MEELKKKFWDRVTRADVSDIKSETIYLVSNDDIEWLIKELKGTN